MRIINKDSSLNEIVALIIAKARYQKVVFCIDENSDIDFIDNIIDGVGKDAIVIKYFINKANNDKFFNIVNNGVRVVVYNVGLDNFYKIKTDNSYLINVFVLQQQFLIPYLSNRESVYAENLLVCNTDSKDYLTLIFMYKLALDKVWANLIQGQEVDVKMFKDIDTLTNGNVGFYDNVATQFNGLSKYLNNDYERVDNKQLPYYVYLQVCAIAKLLEDVFNNDYQYVDFYKTETSCKMIDKAYFLLLKSQIVDMLKLHNLNLIKINNAILNRIKILIKKYFNFKNINLNKINKLIKTQSKDLNIDNLLYISYIFNSI